MLLLTLHLFLYKSKLQDSMIYGKYAKEAFQSVFGKEKNVRLRCYRRNVVPSYLKRKEEL